MKYSPIERVAARLPEAPFYINNMDFPVIVSNAWEAMKKYKMYSTKRHFITRTIEDYEVKLDCDAQIHNVVLYDEISTLPTQDIIHPNQVIFVADPDDEYTTELDTDTDIEKIMRVIPHIIGIYVDYKEEDNGCLKFRDTDKMVGIEYTSLHVDAESGYPMMHEDAELLVTWYCALQHWSGEFMAGRLDANRVQYAEQKLKEAVYDATSTIRLSQNSIDKIGNILSSFDRKTFGYSM